MELALLKHIKPRQIKLLQEVGIESVEALAMSSPSDIGDIEGMSDKAAKQLIWDSRDALNLTTFKNVAQLRENFEYLTIDSIDLTEIKS
jgi:predicted RecB family nuclease